MLSNHIDPHLIQAAIWQARQAAKRDHVYIVGDLPEGDELRMFVTGCQGSGNDNQKKVALEMNAIAQEPGKNPHVSIFGGDNGYDFGMSSPTDPAFKENVDDTYHSAATPHIADKPGVFAKGNHDDARCTKADWIRTATDIIDPTLTMEKGTHRGIHQIEHFYLRNPNAFAELATGTISLKHLGRFFMPHRYYSLIFGATQLFVIDANTYIRDHLRAIGKSETPLTALEANERNQALWLEKNFAIARAVGKNTILVLHNPPIDLGNRHYKPDTHLYADNNEIIAAQLHFSHQFKRKPANKITHSELLYLTLQEQTINPDLTIAAHNHYQGYIHDGKMALLIAGGGGGDLQGQKYFGDKKEREQVGCYIDDHGFTLLRINTKKQHPIGIEFFSVNNPHRLEFTNKSPRPIKRYSKDLQGKQYQIELFCRKVEDAVDEYFAFLNKRQNEYKYNGHFFELNTKHRADGVIRAHNILAIIRNNEAESVKTMHRKISQLWTGSEEVSKHSLLRIMQKHLDEFNLEISRMEMEMKQTKQQCHTLFQTFSAQTEAPKTVSISCNP